MKVYAFSTGRVRLKRGERGARRYLPGGWREETLPVNVFAVEHPDGVCLFDAGQSALATRPGYFPAWYPYFRLARFELGPGEEAAPQLHARGVDPADVRWIVLSHMHTDHVGGLHAFAGAEILVSAVEWRRAIGFAGRLRGYLPQYWPEGVTPRLVEFPDRPDDLSVPSVDLAGDGRLLLLATPGHTPGHMALLARDGARAYVFAGDVAHEAEAVPDAAPWLAELCAREGATILTTHDSRATAFAAA